MKCALCGKDFEIWNLFVAHARMERHMIDTKLWDESFIGFLAEYIFALQKRIEDLESKSNSN